MLMNANRLIFFVKVRNASIFIQNVELSILIKFISYNAIHKSNLTELLEIKNVLITLTGCEAISNSVFVSRKSFIFPRTFNQVQKANLFDSLNTMIET